MPSQLQIPIKKVIPEISLQKILQNNDVTDFGTFGVWYVNLRIGISNNWLRNKVKAKIDTGASISLFPEIWAEELNLGDGIEYEFYGVYRKRECLLPVRIRKLDISLSDNFSNEIKFVNAWAAFTPIEVAPILIGVKDVLMKCTINSNYETEIMTISKNLN